MAAGEDSLGLCGKTLGKFQIRALLGAGGHGTVYRAFDTLLNRDVALKILSPQDATRSDLVERFLREARLAAKLDHPNIVRVHHVGAKDGYYYIEMELVEGRSVAELLEEHSGGLPQAQVLDLAEQIADALQAAHDEANFIHRDLKPSNVLVTGAGVVKLVDFGLAKPLSEGSGASLGTTGGIFLGTIAYASPEQCRGEMPDCRSDIYSFGATLYHMLTGVPPIPPGNEENELRLLNRIGKEDPVPAQERVPGLDRNLCAIVMKMLAKQPSDRYPSVRAVRHDLKAMKEGEPLSQSLVGSQTRRVPLQRMAQYVGTPQRRIAAVVLGLALLGFLVGWLLITQLHGKAAPAQAKQEQEQKSPAFIITRAFGRQTLDLSNTQATDADLAALKNWQDFQDLNLCGTHVTDAGLAALEGKRIHLLRLDGILVTDTGLAHLKAMARLEWLDLSVNRVTVGKVTDATLARVAELKNLSGLLLRNCVLVTDAGVTALQDMTGLDRLDLSGTQITDAGLESLKMMKGLQILYLTDTRITDAGVRQIKEFKHLGRLELCGTKITDAGLADLKELKELAAVLLYKNPQLTKAGIAGLKAALPQTKVWTDADLKAAMPQADIQPSSSEAPPNSVE